MYSVLNFIYNIYTLRLSRCPLGARRKSDAVGIQVNEVSNTRVLERRRVYMGFRFLKLSDTQELDVLKQRMLYAEAEKWSNLTHQVSKKPELIGQFE